MGLTFTIFISSSLRHFFINKKFQHSQMSWVGFLAKSKNEEKPWSYVNVCRKRFCVQVFNEMIMHITSKWKLLRTMMSLVTIGICRTTWHRSNPLDTGRKLNVHKTFRRRPGRLLKILCKFNLRLASTGNWTKVAISFKLCIESHFLYHFEIHGLPLSQVLVLLNWDEFSITQ